MVIVCGTDLCVASAAASRAAAALASVWKQPLRLVHVAGPDEQGRLPPSTELLRDLLHDQADDLAAGFGVHVRAEVVGGVVDEELCESAAGAEMLVVGSSASSAAPNPRLGRVADLLSRTSPVPLLVVRDARPIEDWACRGARLKTVVGFGGGAPSRAALSWANGLHARGACELLIANAYRWSGEPERREGRTPVAQDATWERALTRAIGAPACGGATTFRSLPTTEGTAEMLVRMAEHGQAGLLVLGRRRGAASSLRPSLASRALSLCARNVACIPAQDERASAPLAGVPDALQSELVE